MNYRWSTLLSHCIMKNFSQVFFFSRIFRLVLREKSPYSEFFWSVFSRIRIENGEIQSTNAEKYGLEEVQLRTLFTQWGSVSEKIKTSESPGIAQEK